MVSIFESVNALKFILTLVWLLYSWKILFFEFFNFDNFSATFLTITRKARGVFSFFCIQISSQNRCYIKISSSGSRMGYFLRNMVGRWGA